MCSDLFGISFDLLSKLLHDKAMLTVSDGQFEVHVLLNRLLLISLSLFDFMFSNFTFPKGPAKLRIFYFQVSANRSCCASLARGLPRTNT